MKKRIYFYPSGFAGMALYSYKLANALQKEGAEVTLFAYENYELDNLPALFQKRKILSTGCLSFKYQQSAWQRKGRIIGARVKNLFLFYRAVVRERPRIAHVQELFYPLDWALFYFLSHTSSRLVLTVHDVLPHQFYSRHFRPLEVKILSLIYHLADCLIVHSQTNRSQLLSRFHLDPAKVVVIPHGEYSLEQNRSSLSREAAKRSLGLSPQDKVILFFGHIRQDKGLDILLQAFREVVKVEKHTVLVIAGLPTGESFEKYERLIQQWGLQSRVRSFLEYIETKDIARYFLSADFVCLPYTSFFSQSGVLHLAQAFGRPVIVSRTGGLAEVVTDGLNGLVVPPAKVDKLKEAMIFLLQNPALGRQMGEQAFRISQDQFSWSSIAKKTIHLAYKISG